MKMHGRHSAKPLTVDDWERKLVSYGDYPVLTLPGYYTQTCQNKASLQTHTSI